MNKQELRRLGRAAANPSKTYNNFGDYKDIQSAFINALIEYVGIEDLTPRAIRNHKNAIFAIVEEMIDEVVPERINTDINPFAEVKQIARDEAPMFKVEKKGRDRMAKGVTRGSRGGIYRARRLDNEHFMIETKTETVGLMMTLEELLLGKITLAEMVSIVTTGLTEKIFLEVIEALRVAKTDAPAANISSGADVDFSELDRLIRIIRAYGTPIIIGFDSVTSKIYNNSATWGSITPNIPEADLNELRSQKIVSVYKGTQLVTLPNYLTDNTNENWALQEKDLFIMPVGTRPVKVVFQGQSYMSDVQQPHGGLEWHMHVNYGVGVLYYNNIAVYTDTNVVDSPDAV